MKLYFNGQNDEKDGVMLNAWARLHLQDQAYAVQYEIGRPVL